MDIRGREFEGWTLIEFDGSLDLHIIQDFKNLFKHLSKQNKNILFDFKNLKKIDSSGISCLMFGQKILFSNNLKFRISNLNPAVKIVFQITRGYEIFDIYDELEYAISDNVSIEKNKQEVA